MENIPLIDISPLLSDSRAARQHCADELGHACRDIGFAYVTGHGVPAEQIDAMRGLCKQLFAIDQTEKLRQAITRDNYRGFIPLGFFNPNHGGGERDLYEGYKLHWECAENDPVRDECAVYNANRWPDQLPEMRTTVLDYWHSCEQLGDTLLRGFALALRLPEQHFTTLFDKPLTNMTLLHYPPQPAQHNGHGIHPHKDTCAFTILYPDPAGGLDVRRRDGHWIAADCPKDAFVINIGDMMELWSGAEFVSTPHRVINRSGCERYSFPWFAVPNHAVVVEPLVATRADFSRAPLPVGEVSLEVWRTNWSDETPSDAGYDLGTLSD